MTSVKNLQLVNNRGDSLPDADFSEHLIAWERKHPNGAFGPIARYTWEVQGQRFHRLNLQGDHFRILPDASGFLLVENNDRPDNLLLLDAYGKERMRLSIPWEMTDAQFVEGGKEQVQFLGLATPWPNPATGEEGHFGVRTTSLNRWGSAYYFELDYKTGRFLWCRFLERG